MDGGESRVAVLHGLQVRSKGGQFSRLIVLVWACVFAFIGVLSITLRQSYVTNQQRLEEQVRFSARLLEGHATEIFERADQTLIDAIQHVEPQDLAAGPKISETRQKELQAMLSEHQRRFPAIVSMSLTDSEGIVFANSVGGANGTSLASRQYFIQLKDSVQNSPVVSELLKGRVSNKWGQQFARRINFPDGRFGGMLVANIGTEEGFLGFYKTLDLYPKDILALFHSNSTLLARYPVVEEILGKPTKSPDLAKALASGKSEILLRHISNIDGIERFIILKKLPNYPVFILYGRWIEDAFRQWRFSFLQAIFGSAIAVFSAIVISIGLMRLQKAMAQVEAATVAKSRFLANMSHEIRTPMNVIIGFTSNLRREVADQEQIVQLDRIYDAALHLLGIINDVLDMSKIEAGKLDVNSEELSLRSLLSSVHQQFQIQFTAKRVELRLDVDPQIPDILFGDGLRLKQCLFNYLSNALKFTDKGLVTIGAVLENQTDTVALIRFEVSDDGIGIDSESLKRLFSPFEQGDMTTTRQFGGTGLGLVLTKQLASLMGGEVGVDSTPGQGSRFWFTALLRLAEDTERTAAPAVKAEPVQPRDFSSFRVLLVEDTETNRQVMRLLLSKTGLQVDEAENGQIAVEMARANRYDLILMDLRMPVMDGFAATKNIRGLAGYAETPIIALTANAFDDDRQLCLSAGMSDFLSKPVHSDKLYAALSNWLG